MEAPAALAAVVAVWVAPAATEEVTVALVEVLEALVWAVGPEEWAALAWAAICLPPDPAVIGVIGPMAAVASAAAAVQHPWRCWWWL